MRPGQLHPNELETAILERIVAENPGTKLNIDRLHILERTFTGVGSFTKFVSKSMLYTGERRDLGISGIVSIPGLVHGLGVVAFFKHGELDVLETFTYGDEKWDGVYDGFFIGSAAKPATMNQSSLPPTEA